MVLLALALTPMLLLMLLGMGWLENRMFDDDRGENTAGRDHGFQGS